MENIKSYIVSMFYIQHCSTKEIAEKTNVSESYVTKIVKKDIRYTEEKEMRKANSKEKRKEYKRNNEKHKRENRRIDDNYSFVKSQHEQDARLLSKSSRLSNQNYRRWNYSAYKYNPLKKRYEFDSSLGRSADVPKYIRVEV